MEFRGRVCTASRISDHIITAEYRARELTLLTYPILHSGGGIDNSYSNLMRNHGLSCL